MRVLYAGLAGGTCAARHRILSQWVTEALYIKYDDYFDGRSALMQRLGHYFFVGPWVRRLNQRILREMAALKPQVVWIDRGLWIWPETLRAIRDRGALLVHYFTDAIFPRRWNTRVSFRLLRDTLPLYDLVIAANPADIRWIERQPGIHLISTPMACAFAPFAEPSTAQELERWKSDVLFIGHYERRTERFILALADAGVAVTVYGAHWHKARNAERLAGRLHCHPVIDRDYVAALRSAKIALCFLSEQNYDVHTTRSFEIPAAGTFMLAMRTDSHQALYQEGVEAEFFSDAEELVRKAKHYLTHEADRESIARRGHARCMADNHSFERYMREFWSFIIEKLGERGVADDMPRR